MRRSVVVAAMAAVSVVPVAVAHSFAGSSIGSATVVDPSGITLVVDSPSRDGRRLLLGGFSARVFDRVSATSVPVPAGVPLAVSSDGTKVLVSELVPGPSTRLSVLDLAQPSGNREVVSATSLVPGSMSGDGQVVAWTTTDAGTGIERAWVRNATAAPVELTGTLPGIPTGQLGRPIVSADGRFVVFEATLSGPSCVLTSSCRSQVFRASVPAAGSTSVVLDTVGVTPSGAASSGDATLPEMSANGRYVFFRSSATDLVAGLTTVRPRLYRRDLVTNTTSAVVDGTVNVQPSPYSGWLSYAIDETAQRIVYRGSPAVLPPGAPPASAAVIRIRDLVDDTDVVVGAASTALGTVALSGDGRVLFSTDTDTGGSMRAFARTLPPVGPRPPVVGAGPTRLLDTRPGSRVGWSSGKPASGQVLAVNVPVGNVAVALNVTGVDAAAPGYVTVFPCGRDRPSTSNLNLNPGEISPNAVIVGVGTNDTVCLFTQQGTHLVVDLNAVFPLGSPIVPRMPPDRVLDTRIALGHSGPKPPARAVVPVGAGVSPGDLVIVNVTGVDATADGYVTAFPCEQPLPTASNLNLRAGATTPNLVAVRAGAQGRFCLFTQSGTHLVADVLAVVPASATAFRGGSPVRYLDTRPGSRVGWGGPKPAAGATPRVGLPSGTAVVFLNVTGVDATADGYVTAYPCGNARLTASNLNLVPQRISPNLVVVAAGSENQTCLFTQSGTHFVVDLLATVA